MKKLLLALILIPFVCCAVWAQDASETDSDASPARRSTEQSKRQLVAMGEWQNKSGAPDEIFETLRDRITNQIVNTRKFDVVERERIKELVRERNLVESGLVSEEGAPTPGKIKAAGYILYGTVLTLGLSGAGATVGDDVTAARRNAKVEISLRITNAEDGRILASKEVSATQSGSNVVSGNTSIETGGIGPVLNDAIRIAAEKVTQALLELAFPIRIVHVGVDSVMINVAKEQTQDGAIYEVFRPGEEMIDPDTGESLGSSEEFVGLIKVIRVKPKVAEAEPIGNLRIEQLEKGMIVRPEDPEKVRKREQQKREQRRQEFESRF